MPFGVWPVYSVSSGVLLISVDTVLEMLDFCFRCIRSDSIAIRFDSNSIANQQDTKSFIYPQSPTFIFGYSFSWD